MTDAEINQSCSLSAFEKLPGEIRNKIYNLVLRHNDCPGKDSVISVCQVLALMLFCIALLNDVSRYLQPQDSILNQC